MSAVIEGEVIYCKDCKFYVYHPIYRQFGCTNNKGLRYPANNEFCSYAEDREKDDKPEQS